MNVEWDGETQTVDIMLPKATVTNVEYTKINGINCVVVTANSAITGYKYFMLNETEPYRLILDVKNSAFKFDTSSKNIDDEFISTIRYGVQENDVNRIVLDLKKETDYIVVQSQDKTKLYYALAAEFEIPGETLDDGIINSGDKDSVLLGNDKNTNSNPENIMSGDINNSNGEEKEDKPSVCHEYGYILYEIYPWR